MDKQLYLRVKAEILTSADLCIISLKLASIPNNNHEGTCQKLRRGQKTKIGARVKSVYLKKDASTPLKYLVFAVIYTIMI